MKKRDRTGEEKQVDKLIKIGIRRLGETPAQEQEQGYRHRFRYDMFGRMGQNCRILKNSGTLSQIEFEDGFIAQVRRTALRRRNDATT